MLRAILCAAVLMVATSANAAQRLALVIGNAAYESEAMPSLANPANDAALMAKRLEEATFDVTLVLDADLRTMKEALRDFANAVEDAGEGALALFYYSGHGFQANGLNYLAPIGADLRDEVDAEYEALAVDWVLARLENAHGGANVVILDACRNTALSRAVGGGLALIGATPPGSFISFATAPGSTAADGNGLNSPYTAAIAAELTVPGQSIEAMFKAVRRRVVSATGGFQVPWDHSSLTTDIMFVPDGAATAGASAPPPTGPQMAMELEFWSAVKDSDDPAELQAYLTRFPEGAFAPLARARLAADAPNGDIERLFAALQNRATIVAEPTRPHEFYANARLHELRGDYLRARQDYLKYFAFDPPYVDPHLRFQRFLTAQDGRAGAERVYRALASGAGMLPTGFAAALLQERPERIAMLEAIVARNPDYAPAVYALSQDYSEAALGAQSSADKEREKALLERFEALDEAGEFLRHYLDQQAAADALEDAKVRLAALSALNMPALANPVSMMAMRSNSGWTVTLQITDTVREIFVARPGEEFRSTGYLGVVDPQTGHPIPSPNIELDPTVEETVLRVRYTDLRGDLRGPFELPFEAASALVSGQKQILEMLTNAWIATRPWEGQTLVYFTHLISYRCAIDTVAYSYDGDALDRTYALAPCDARDPHVVKTASGNDTDIYQAAPGGAHSISVQLTYKDGTRSDVKRFPIE
ncbi:caspase family protein [Acuticoccus sp. M5D2P5]|uniref:caspase family protein n=1 Tax=Acuticoccus kalidii TaxID=2910977 RepID=UPI001F47CCD2|nr:caspase family protein [Acuticoccus kalidii]MCF3936055.1 caspase family protein [Acuticoccus kalidii]